jgi:hypothetical protein
VAEGLRKAKGLRGAMVGLGSGFTGTGGLS